MTPSGNALKAKLLCQICRTEFKIDMHTVPPERHEDVPPRMVWDGYPQS